MKGMAPAAKMSGAPAALGVSLDVADRPASQVRWSTNDVAEMGARIVVVSLFTLMAVRIGSDFLVTGRVTGLLLLASELLVIVLTMMRRTTSIVDRSYRARTLTALSMLGPVMLRPAATAPLAPETLTVLCSVVGLSIVIGGKLSLGRSFGLIPANRGVVSKGLYRFVRHPIYLGYLIIHASFVAANPTLWNIVMLIGADLALMCRAVCEEKTLGRDDAYRGYQQVVRWRVVPGLF